MVLASCKIRDMKIIGITLLAFLNLAPAMAIESGEMRSRVEERIQLSRHITARIRYLAFMSDNLEHETTSALNRATSEAGSKVYPYGGIAQALMRTPAAAMVFDYMSTRQQIYDLLESARQLQRAVSASEFFLDRDTTLANLKKRGINQSVDAVLAELRLENLVRQMLAAQAAKRLVAMEIIMLQNGWISPDPNSNPDQWKGPSENNTLNVTTIKEGKDFIILPVTP